MRGRHHGRAIFLPRSTINDRSVFLSKSHRTTSSCRNREARRRWWTSIWIRTCSQFCRPGKWNHLAHIVNTTTPFAEINEKSTMRRLRSKSAAAKTVAKIINKYNESGKSRSNWSLRTKSQKYRSDRNQRTYRRSGSRASSSEVLRVHSYALLWPYEVHYFLS